MSAIQNLSEANERWQDERRERRQAPSHNSHVPAEPTDGDRESEQDRAQPSTENLSGPE